MQKTLIIIKDEPFGTGKTYDTLRMEITLQKNMAMKINCEKSQFRQLINDSQMTNARQQTFQKI